MAVFDQPPIGRLGENVWNARLAAELRNNGFPSADFEVLFPTLKGIRKPDVAFEAERGAVIVSGKLGERQEVDAIVAAQEYQQTLGKIGAVQEAVSVTYPAKPGEMFHVRALATEWHDSMPWACRSLSEVVEKIVALARRDWAKVKIGLESSVSAAIRVLRVGVADYSSKLTKVHVSAVEQVFGGEEFFETILGYEKAQKNKDRVLRSAAAYLLLNQVMFYEILARETQKYPPIAEADYNKPTLFKPKYFDLVLQKDYRPIFAFDVAGSLTDRKIGEASGKIVRAVKALFPGKVDHDIVGKIFHSLIPLEMRKLVAAYFTNAQAGDLLARLSIGKADARVIDPACGSGTLLVSSYKTKAKLSGRMTARIHRQFVEEDLTGTDIMAFSAHLAAVNLALQAPLFETDNIRVAVTDSTGLRIGSKIEQAREVFKHAFRTRRLDEFAEGPLRPKRHERGRVGTISIGQSQRETITIDPADLVIMNPPFTNSDVLPKLYKEELEKRFSEPKEHAACIQGNLSFQAYFLLLADRLLKQRGWLACVLPLTTFSGKAFGPTINYLLGRYAVVSIIVGIGRSAFSENTSLSEVLFIAQRTPPLPENQFVLMGVKKSPTDWTDPEIDELVTAIREAKAKETPLYISRLCPQEELRLSGRGLTALLSELNPSMRIARKLMEPILNSPSAAIFSEVLESIGSSSFFYEIGNPDRFSKEHGRGSNYFGFSALFILSTAERMLKKSDFLVVDENKGALIVKNRYDNSRWEIPESAITPCIRRISGITKLDFTDHPDYVIAEYYNGLSRLIRSIYPAQKAEFFEGRIKEEWQNKVRHGLSNLCLARRIDLSAKGTSLLAVFNENPMLLAANSWGFRGLRLDQAKILALWFNSTIFLVSLLTNRMQTRGTFGQIDSRQLSSMRSPDIGRFSPSVLGEFVRLFDQLKLVEFPSIVEQLQNDFSARVEIDDIFLRSLGVSDADERKMVGKSLRKAAAAQMHLMQTAMSGD